MLIIFSNSLISFKVICQFGKELLKGVANGQEIFGNSCVCVCGGDACVCVGGGGGAGGGGNFEVILVRLGVLLFQDLSHLHT